MNLRGWWEDKLKGNCAAGIEIQLHGSVLRIHWVLLAKKRSKLEITASGAAGAISEIQLPPGTPAALSISGKGIIHKKVSHKQEMDAASLLPKVLPNARPAEFYVQWTEPVSHSAIVSVARRSSIDELLNEFKKIKLDIVSCTLGPFCIASILPAANEREEIRLPGHTISISEGQVESYMSEENKEAAPVLVDSELAEASLVIPLAAGTEYFTGYSANIDIPHVAEVKDNFRQKKIFRFTGAGLLIILLTTLLINYFLFDHYWKKKQALEAATSANAGAWQKYTALKAAYDEKISFLQGTGLLDASRASFYADRIAKGVPGTIQLSEMNINPCVKTDRENMMQFETDNIRLSGYCKRSDELNEWMKQLGKKDWIHKVELINYTQGKADPSGTFTINIKMR